jgi:hypothetical protein
MDELEGCITELLKQHPGTQILAVTKTAERAAALQLRFATSPVMAVCAFSPLYAGRFDAIVTEVKATDATWEWAMDVLPRRMAPNATMYTVSGAA